MTIRRPLCPLLLGLCLFILFLLEGLHLPLYHTAFQGQFDAVHTISGIVETMQLKKGYAALQVDIGKEKVLVRLKDVSDEAFLYDLIGRQVTATGNLEEPEGKRNPGSFNYKYYLCARGCYSILSCSKYKFQVGDIHHPLTHFAAFQKGSFLIKAKEMMSSSAFGITTGILFGDKSYLDSSVYEEFQSNGIAHVLAVSGLHIGLVYGLVRKFIRKKTIGTSLLIGMGLFCYAFFASFSVSVLRAGGMILLSLLAFHLNRRYDMLSAACFVAILTLLKSPYYLYDSGAQLSFMAAFSIAVLMPYFDIKWKRYCDKHKWEKQYRIGSIFLPGIVLQIGMGPLMIFHFLNFSPLSLFLNPIAIYLASLLLPAGLAAFALSALPMLLAGACRVAEVLSWGLLHLSSAADHLLHGITMPAPPLGLLLLYYAFLFFYFSETRVILIRSRKQFMLTLIYVGLAIGCAFLPFALGLTNTPLPWAYNRYSAVFLDVGQGDACHLQSKGVHLLLDGGGSVYKDLGKDTLEPYFLKNGIRSIDLAMVSHIDTDHSKGIADLSKRMPIKTLIFPISAKEEDLSDFHAEKIIFVDKGDQIQMGDATITILSARGKDSNSGSIVCQIDFPNKAFLFMGDAPMETEKELSFTDIDILKVGHHGSKTSTGDALLDKAMPEIAILSCGKNNRYGHPTKEVLQRLENHHVILRRTDLEGAICIP